MLQRITCNGVDYLPSDSGFPMLIHGKEGSGASLFTISLVANLYQSGFKLLCLTGFEMASKEFLQQVGKQDNIFRYPWNNSIPDSSKKAILITRENTESFLGLVDRLDDIEERVVLVKNIELFGDEVIERVKAKNRLIISGDIDKCERPLSMLDLAYNSKIMFSKSTQIHDVAVPELPKYHGYIKNRHLDGVIGVTSQ